MKECCNFNCNNPVWTKKIRCSPCRKKSIQECASCGTQVSDRAMRCKECILVLHYNYIKKWHKENIEISRAYQRAWYQKQINKSLSVN